VPYAIGYAGGLAADFLAAILHKEFPVSAIRIKKFCATTQFRSSEISKAGFRAPVTLQQGLERTITYEFLGGREKEASLPLFDSE
jgi:hypothetical protein